MTRSSMLEVLGEDYIRTAKAKGLNTTRIVIVHALRNALIPVVTVVRLNCRATAFRSRFNGKHLLVAGYRQMDY